MRLPLAPAQLAAGRQLGASLRQARGGRTLVDVLSLPLDEPARILLARVTA